MSYSGGSAPGPRVKCDQVIYEALCKACEIIVGSRATDMSGMNATEASGSGRFHLQIPAIPAVRAILQPHRLQLHVPIRLEVYSQHEDGNRELLERWCLEYEIVGAERFFAAEGLVTNDPMVQLTHVCKRVVLWLRTLYCWTRLLAPPTAASGALGFSIYVPTPTDAAEVELPGFLRQRGSGVVTTPYGALAWQVWYRPQPEKQRSVRLVAPPRSRPIPVASRSTQPHTETFVPHSAPAHHRPPTYTERSQQKRWEAAAQHASPPPMTGKSYETGRHLYKKSLTEWNEGGSENGTAHPLVVQRSHSTLGTSPQRVAPSLPDSAPPERVLSGLSLALLMAENENTPGRSGSIFRETPAGPEEEEEQSAAEASSTRRVALHQMPPHLQEGTALSMGDYGYGYNNHIPWQKIHPSQSNPALAQPTTSSLGRALSSSPSSFAIPPSQSPQHFGTPGALTPPGVFYRSTPPVAGLGHFIPPRNRTDSKSVTPPFPSRPVGFDPPSFSLEPSQVSSRHTEAAKTLSQVPMTSLDSLRSSPFQQPQRLVSEDRASMLSSFAVPALEAPEERLRHSLWGSSAVMPSSLASGLAHPDDYSEEMPFAVEIPTEESQMKGSKAFTTASTTFGNASSLASLAQRCAVPNQRLKMFDQVASSNSASVAPASDDMASPNVDPMHSLADQLQEFRAFGASLHTSIPNFGVADEPVLAGSGASSTSTPISLRS